jgi:hypothetical protein
VKKRKTPKKTKIDEKCTFPGFSPIRNFLKDGRREVAGRALCSEFDALPNGIFKNEHSSSFKGDENHSFWYFDEFCIEFRGIVSEGRKTKYRKEMSKRNTPKNEISERKYLEGFVLAPVSISKDETSKSAKIERINFEKEKFR